MNFDNPPLNEQGSSECPEKLARKEPSLDVLSAGPISVLLPLPCSRAESAILSAWTLLLKSYYSQNSVAFLKLGGKGTHRSPSEAGKPESISVDLQSEWSAMDLQEVLCQRLDSPSASGQGTGDDSGRYAVWLANEEDMLTDECRQEICNLGKAFDVGLCRIGTRTNANLTRYTFY